MNKYFFALIIILISVGLYADIKVEAYVNSTKVRKGQQFRYTIEISGDDADKVKQPDLPKIKNIKNRGVSTSSSSSISIINGKMTQSVTKQYNYSLVSLQEGNVLIPPVNIKFKGKNYTTSPIKVNVSNKTAAASPSYGNNYASSNRSRNNDSDNFEDNLFIEVDYPKGKNFYEGQAIPFRYRLYKRYNIANLSFEERPAINDVWIDKRYEAEQADFRPVNKNGTRYEMLDLRTEIIRPNKTGTIIIPELSMNVDVILRSRSFFDFDRTQSYVISCSPVKLNVKPLPPTDSPYFTGAIGNFSIRSEVSKTELKAGDSFTYTLRIKGNGNFQYFDAPSLPENPHFRFMEPEKKVIVDNSAQGSLKGSLELKYLVIPREEGKHSLPAVKFTYFNPDTKSYKTLTAKEYQFNISKGDYFTMRGGTAQNTVLMEGKDIAYIKKTAHPKSFKPFFEQLWFWIVSVLLLLTFIPSLIIYNEKSKLESNSGYGRNKRADKILKKYLKQAQDAAASGSINFYAAAQNGLMNYLTDKLNLDRGTESSIVIKMLKEKLPDSETVIKFEDFIKKCNQARFMPGGFNSETATEDFKLLKEILNKLNLQGKK
ncbi:MAG: hypothetical protein CSB55_05865 [Candidatus Cloacimonadota bacterium]|nr:MAG: hypothetical protein CSB55_05865 [Candidatus Cloacimonadota bacterium]